MSIVSIRGPGERAASRPARVALRRSRVPRGMTLLELMLVLALMVVIGAMSLPAMQHAFDNQRLRMAGEQVRVEWNKACIRAMKTGQILMFRCEPGGSTFNVEPYFTGQEWLEADARHSESTRNSSAGLSSAVGQATPIGQADVAAVDAAAAKPHTLPAEVVFVAGSVEADSRAVQIQQDTQGAVAPDTGEVAPILFYPDGTTSDARICLTNKRQMCVEVSLRSLTGTAKVSPLMSVEEYQQLEQLRQ